MLSPKTNFTELGISKAGSHKKVRAFRFASLDDQKEYEALLNSANSAVYKEAVSYDRNGNPIITVWWEVTD
jgi:hypothetical protein